MIATAGMTFPLFSRRRVQSLKFVLTQSCHFAIFIWYLPYFWPSYFVIFSIFLNFEKCCLFFEINTKFQIFSHFLAKFIPIFMLNLHKIFNFFSIIVRFKRNFKWFANFSKIFGQLYDWIWKLSLCVPDKRTSHQFGMAWFRLEKLERFRLERLGS